MWKPAGDRIAPASGCGRTAAGIGKATSRGRGRVITMVIGPSIRFMAGSGFPESSGGRRG